MKVLSIGNSFSEDAQRYLHRVAKNENFELKTINLYIGGCSLEHHYRNMLGDKKEYDLCVNGENSGFKVAMEEVLLSDEWDVITLQQVSHLAPYYDTYEPYLSGLTEYVRKYAPKVKLLLHQTWAYEQGSQRLNDELGIKDQHEMFEMIEKAYSKAAKSISADGIIPCGKAMIEAIDLGIGKIHRDTFHADLGVGRYLLALTWFKSLTGKNVQNEFNCFDVNVDKAKIEIVKKVVQEIQKVI